MVGKIKKCFFNIRRNESHIDQVSQIGFLQVAHGRVEIESPKVKIPYRYNRYGMIHERKHYSENENPVEYRLRFLLSRKSGLHKFG